MAALADIRYNLSAEGEPTVVRGARVTASFFPVLGIAPVLGRDFTAGGRAGRAARVAVLS